MQSTCILSWGKLVCKRWKWLLATWVNPLSSLRERYRSSYITSQNRSALVQESRMGLVKQSDFCCADNNRLQHTPSATGLPGEEGQACIPAICHPHQWKPADVASNDIQNKQPHCNMQSSVPQATTQASEQTRMIHFSFFFLTAIHLTRRQRNYNL